MSHETDRRRYILPKLSRGNYNVLMKMIVPRLSDPANFRLHVLGYYYQHGWKNAVDAFGVCKSTLYDWKRVYEVSGKWTTHTFRQSTKQYTHRVKVPWRILSAWSTHHHCKPQKISARGKKLELPLCNNGFTGSQKKGRN